MGSSSTEEKHNEGSSIVGPAQLFLSYCLAGEGCALLLSSILVLIIPFLKTNYPFRLIGIQKFPLAMRRTPIVLSSNED